MSPRIAATVVLALALCWTALPARAADFVDGIGRVRFSHPDGVRVWEIRSPTRRRIVVDGILSVTPFRFSVVISRQPTSTLDEEISAQLKRARSPFRRVGDSLTLLGKRVKTVRFEGSGFQVELGHASLAPLHLATICQGSTADWAKIRPLCHAMARSLRLNTSGKPDGILGSVGGLTLEVRRKPRVFKLWHGYAFYPNHFTVLQVRNLSGETWHFRRGVVRSVDRGGNLIAIRAFGKKPLLQDGWIFDGNGLGVNEPAAAIPPLGGLVLALQSRLAAQMGVDRIKLRLEFVDSSGSERILERDLEPKTPRSEDFRFPFVGETRVRIGPRPRQSQRPRYVVLAGNGDLISGAPTAWHFRRPRVVIGALGSGTVAGVWRGPTATVIVNHGGTYLRYELLDPKRVAVKRDQRVTRGETLGYSSVLGLRLRSFAGKPFLSPPTPLQFSALVVLHRGNWIAHRGTLKQGERVRRGHVRHQKRRGSKKKIPTPVTRKP